MGSGELSWSCVCCGRAFGTARPDACAACGTETPSIFGIPVLTFKPHVSIDALPTQLANVPDAAQPVNREALKRVLEPALAQAAGLPQRPIGMSDFMTQMAGWWGIRFEYLYIDWTDTEEFRADRAFFLDAALRHCPDRGVAAVLGCGAGGLVASLATAFPASLGLDLSLPHLLLADHLLRGGTLSLQLPQARWRQISMRGPATPPRGAGFIVADAAALPFAPGSISLVVTQYLLDIAGEPTFIAREINRVLSPGGVWINLGLPFRRSSDPPEVGPLRSDDMPAFLDDFAFDALEIRRRRALFHDLSALDEWLPALVHSTIFFAAQKRGDLEPDPVARAFEDHAARRGTTILDRIPRFIASRRIHLLEGWSFGPGGAEPCVELSSPICTSMPIPGPLGAFLRRLLQSIDGKRTAREVLAALGPASGEALTEDDFVVLLRTMRLRGWIEIG
ncbi:methyltransferase domain-containing protein [Sorangium sp. So ce1128]